jgi:hypothetical protein
MSKEREFCDKFRADLSPGKRYYKRLPMSYVDYVNAQPIGALPNIMDMQTHEEQGVKLEMASSDFERLMLLAMEGAEHKQFRDLHPAAQEAYNQYQTMYLMTRKYNEGK